MPKSIWARAKILQRAEWIDHDKNWKTKDSETNRHEMRIELEYLNQNASIVNRVLDLEILFSSLISLSH